MRSPSIGHASRATKNGAVKLMEAAFASGRYFTPVKKNSIDIRCTMERMICHLGVAVRSTATPMGGTNRASYEHEMRGRARPHDLLGAVALAQDLHEPVHDGKQRARRQHEQDAEERPVGRARSAVGGMIGVVSAGKGRARMQSRHCRGTPARGVKATARPCAQTSYDGVSAICRSTRSGSGPLACSALPSPLGVARERVQV